MDRVSQTDPIWRVTGTQKAPIPITRLNGEVVWINTSTTSEPDDATLAPDDELRIAEATLSGQSELRTELETVFAGADWPQVSKTIEAFKRYATKIFDVNATAYRKAVLAQDKDSDAALRSMARNLLKVVFGSEWERSPGEEVVRTNWQCGTKGWIGTEVVAIAGNDPDPNCLFHQLVGDAIQYRYRFHAILPVPIPGEPPGINLSNLEWWQYIGLKERHNLAMAIKPYIEDRVGHWQFAYGSSATGHADATQEPVCQADSMRELQVKKRSLEKSGDAIVHGIAAKVMKKLEHNEHYANGVRADFDSLLLQVLTFCADRLDAAPAEIGERGDYRFRPDAREWDLQADLREWLRGNFRHGEVRTEVSGIATGRADIYVSFGGTRFILELKKEESNASPAGLHKYLGQAVAYQATNVRLGFLGVLDLTHHGSPAPHLEENVWVDEVRPNSDGPARHIVVFRVTGNLSRPSEIKLHADEDGRLL